MATVFARMAAFRARYPRKLVGAAVILVITVLLAVYNQRMAMGHWSYRSEFDITVKGQSDCYLPEMCYYTLKERNMWKRVQCNADWYWYKRCQGNRDGLESPKGLNQTEGKLSSPVSILSLIYRTTMLTIDILVEGFIQVSEVYE